MKIYTFCYTMPGSITVEAEDLDQAEALAEEQDIYWDETAVDYCCVIENEED